MLCSVTFIIFFWEKGISHVLCAKRLGKNFSTCGLLQPLLNGQNPLHVWSKLIILQYGMDCLIKLNISIIAGLVKGKTSSDWYVPSASIGDQGYTGMDAIS
jgi:hypothetical protein